MVFVVQDVKNKNILPAQKFGELAPLLPEGNIIFASQSVVATLYDRLNGYTDADFLLLIGDPVAIGMAAAIAAKVNNGCVNFLKWDKQEKRYYVVRTKI